MIEKIKFIINESIKSFSRYPMQSLISSLTITICLLILSFVIYLSNVSNNLSDNFKSKELFINVYIDNKNNDFKSKQICEDIDKIIKSDSFQFLSKNKIYNDMNISKSLDELIGNDIDFLPCLCKYDINVGDTDIIDQMIDSVKLKHDSDISKIVYPKSYLTKFEKFISMIYSIIFLLGIIVLIVSIFNTSNVIKLNINSRREVLKTMILHGADDYLIKLPYLIEGMFHGLIASLISSGIILFIFNLDMSFDSNHFVANSFFSTLSAKSYVFLNLILGILLGYLGSNLGVNKNKIEL